jgi:hypothetical protein
MRSASCNEGSPLLRLRTSDHPCAGGRALALPSLGLPPDDGDRLEFLYQLRCAFGAHPPPTKWWDFGEIYEAEINELFDVSRRVLWQLASLERTHRRIEPAPERWSSWFVENAEWLLEVTWFLRTP